MSKIYMCWCGSMGSSRLGCFAKNKTGVHLCETRDPALPPEAGVRPLDLTPLADYVRERRARPWWKKVLGR